MLISKNSNLYIYVIARDFGFAPNPFFGCCSLATCKPKIRKSAQPNDWILGVGGRDLGAGVHRKCILLMKVTEKMTFEEYWADPRYILKRPCRNGSQLKMVGDNIYHRDSQNNWIQENSHHSNSDGSINTENLERDTGHCEDVLLSDFFFYFGSEAKEVDLESVNYISKPGCKKISLDSSNEAREIINNIYKNNISSLNTVVSDPCQFSISYKRVSQKTGKIIV
ncbi:hypothetical protein LPA49_07465 [Pseudoalteromonas sp. MB41]|uniref:Nmad2 family putative nucleotide modification protein n=1 Tax=Pseudoalteromonas sp. MB41 TaxID=2896366 RepID=UPI001E3E5DB8|nr:hypothetical protein [Pseudoalteromonas sp. MB41]MCC9660403.1 hypothetical protein [Pseudoalteromonas sp. MB41]